MIPDLTPRERQLLVLKANGYSDAEAAREMKISVRTANKSLQRIYRKFDARSATHAVAIAVAIGEIGIHQITIPTTDKEAA